MCLRSTVAKKYSTIICGMNIFGSLNATNKEGQTLWMENKFKIETLKNVISYYYNCTPIWMWSDFMWLHGNNWMSETYSTVENITNVNIYTCTYIYRSEHMGSQRSIVFLNNTAWVNHYNETIVLEIYSCSNTKIVKSFTANSFIITILYLALPWLTLLVISMNYLLYNVMYYIHADVCM